MSAESEIRRRIRSRGPLTFAEFMEVALYHPEGGYYTSGERVGASGDFYTSPATHPAFGALLAVQLLQMWELVDRPDEFTVVEPGAGNGLLCRDVAGAVEAMGGPFARSLRYICIDRRRGRALERDKSRAGRILSDTIPLRGLVGCVLTNELLDAMPVHQVAVEEGRLREIYVGIEGDRLAAMAGEPSTPLLAGRLADVGVELDEGQVAEVNVGLERWNAEAAGAMERGFLLTIDYGRAARHLYSATERFRGTLTTYRDHIQTDRPLERVGQQDISAQVDFTSVARIGEAAGLEFLGLTSQAEFLDNLGVGVLLQRPSGVSPRGMQTSRTGMRELVKPGGLGDFRVMAQGKKVGRPKLWGFHRSKGAAAVIEGMTCPEPTADHINLLARSYPGSGAEFEVSWEDLWPPDPES